MRPSSGNTVDLTPRPPLANLTYRRRREQQPFYTCQSHVRAETSAANQRRAPTFQAGSGLSRSSGACLESPGKVSDRCVSLYVRTYRPGLQPSHVTSVYVQFMCCAPGFRCPGPLLARHQVWFLCQHSVTYSCSDWCRRSVQPMEQGTVAT